MISSRVIDVVILTHNRKHEALRTIARMRAADAVGSIVVVDNGSGDATADAIASRFPNVRTVRLPRNIGAAARNAGVRETRTPYVAFCDDDTWWSPPSLTRAASILDAYPQFGVITGRVLVGPKEIDDPTNERMQRSPFANELGFPGSEVLGFLAGACVFRRRAFLQAGGYQPRFFIGGEEALLAIDLAVAGWRMGYVPDVVAHHYPSAIRNAIDRRWLLIRNALWCAWLRRPIGSAIAQTRAQLSSARFGDALRGLFSALRGMPWVLRERRVVPAHVERAIAAREAFEATFESMKNPSAARRRVHVSRGASVPTHADNRARRNDAHNPPSPL